MRWLRSHIRHLGLIVALAVVAFTFLYVLPRIADYRAVWSVIKGLDPVWLIALGVATLLNIVTYAPPWMVALPGLRFRQALPFTQASTAITFAVPGGGLVGMAGSFALLRSWGFAAADVTRAVTLTGVWNQLSNLLFPVLAVFMLTAEQETDAGFTTLAFVGAAIFGTVVLALGLVLWREDFAEAIGDLAAAWTSRFLRRVGRGPVGWSGDSFARFRNDTVGLLRRRWHVLTLAALVGNLTVFLLLLVSVRAVGISASELTWVEVFAGWAVGRVLGLIPLTPGGIGVVELGLTGTLVAFGGANAEVVAATLIYRFLSIVPTLVLGGLTMLVWRRLNPTTEGVGEPAVNRPPE
jgi:uncharacterized protein (TIRG00374 family)